MQGEGLGRCEVDGGSGFTVCYRCAGWFFSRVWYIIGMRNFVRVGVW